MREILLQWHRRRRAANLLNDEKKLSFVLRAFLSHAHK